MDILSLITYGIFLRMIFSFILAIGFFVAGCVCQHEIWFHKRNGLTGAMRNVAFSWGVFLLAFAVLSLIGVLELQDTYLITRFISNVLILFSLTWFLWTCWRMLQEMVRGPANG